MHADITWRPLKYLETVRARRWDLQKHMAWPERDPPNMGMIPDQQTLCAGASPGGLLPPPGPPDWRLRRAGGASRGGPGGGSPVAPPEGPLAPEAPTG
eukprot:15249929-Alexandrium_andersonii.AAC.1